MKNFAIGMLAAPVTLLGVSTYLQATSRMIVNLAGLQIAAPEPVDFITEVAGR